MSVHPAHPARRTFLRHAARLTAASVAAPVLARAAAVPGVGAGRSLAMHHTHTGERVDLLYAVRNEYVPAALGTLNHFLRDHYTGDVGTIDPQLFDLLYKLQAELGTREPFHIISGYRCPATNGMLKTTRGGGVAKRSLHMDGKAIDIRLPNVPTARLRDAALSLRAGGVGYYPREQFVHVDTGRVRSW